MNNTKLAPDWWDTGRHQITGYEHNRKKAFEQKKKRKAKEVTDWNPEVHENFR